MQLDKLFEDYQKTKDIAERNLEEIPLNTRGAWGVSIREAKDKLPKLRLEIRNALFAERPGIFLAGPQDKQEEFSAVVRDSGNLVADASALYNRLTNDVETTLTSNNRQWLVGTTQRLTIALQEVMKEVGIGSMRALSTQDMPYVKTRKDIYKEVRRLVRDAAGDTLNKLYVEAALTKSALEICYTNNTSPTLLINAEEDERGALAKIFGRGAGIIVELSAEDSIDAAFVVSKTTESAKNFNIKKHKQQPKKNTGEEQQ